MPDTKIYLSGEGSPFLTAKVLINCSYLDGLPVYESAKGGYVRPIGE